jgi:apolipoprotein N-acyltransferase
MQDVPTLAGLVPSTAAKNTSKRSKSSAIGLFVLALLFWVGTISHDMLGFVAPASGEALGFDAVAVLFWLWPVYAGRNLYRTFARP